MRRVLGQLRTAVADILTRGKSVVDDSRQGGWETLSGTAVVPSTGIWDRMTATDRETAAARVSLIFSCVSYLATTASEAPLRVVRAPVDEHAIEVIENHPLQRLLDRPNMYYSPRLFVQFLVWRLLCTGEYYVWKWRNGLTEMAELWPIPSSWVTVKKGSGSELINHYKVNQGRKTPVTVPPVNMVRQWFADPASTWAAFGPLHALARDYQIEDVRQNLLAELLHNLNVPGLTVSKETEFTPKQKQDLRQAIYGRLSEGGRGRHLLLGGGAKVDLMNPLKDLDTQGLMAMTESRICGGFGVAPMLVGARIGLEHSTYSNWKEARKGLYRETMSPLWRFMGDGLTMGLVTAEGAKDIALWFDTRNIPELQRDLKEESERAASLFRSGLAKRDEGRQMAGLPPVGGSEGETYLIPSTGFERPAGEGEAE